MKKLLTTFGLALLIGCTETAPQESTDSAANQTLAPEHDEPVLDTEDNEDTSDKEEPTDPAPDSSTEPATEEPAKEEPTTEEPQANTKLNADDVLAQAIALAAKDNRRVFVHLGAPW